MWKKFCTLYFCCCVAVFIVVIDMLRWSKSKQASKQKKVRYSIHVQCTYLFTINAHRARYLVLRVFHSLAMFVPCKKKAVSLLNGNLLCFNIKSSIFFVILFILPLHLLFLVSI